MQAESWAFALDSQGLELMMEKGIFWTRTCKVCHGDEGIVVASEYGMSKAILEASFNLATPDVQVGQAVPFLSPTAHMCM